MVGVFLGDDCFVIGIFTVDEPANKTDVRKGEKCIGAVIFYSYFRILGCKNIFKQV